MHGNIDIRRGGIKAAVNSLRKSATPRVLIVDVSAADQPLSALHELSYVTEPDVRVLVIGSRSTISTSIARSPAASARWNT